SNIPPRSLPHFGRPHFDTSPISALTESRSYHMIFRNRITVAVRRSAWGKEITIMKTLCLRTTVFFIVVLAACQLGLAQTSGTIAGRVTDTSGALASDFTVTATQPETGLSRTVTSDSGGLYVIPELPVGTWEVKFAKRGFATFVQRNVLLQVNTSVEVNA